MNSQIRYFKFLPDEVKRTHTILKSFGLYEMLSSIFCDHRHCLISKIGKLVLVYGKLSHKKGSYKCNKNSIGDALTPQPGEIVFSTMRYGT